jgi:hypothetical protein
LGWRWRGTVWLAAETSRSAARETTKGPAAIEKTLNLAADPKRLFRVEPINYSFLGDDVALVDATYGGAKPAGHALYVMVKRDGK